jgi:expansin
MVRALLAAVILLTACRCGGDMPIAPIPCDDVEEHSGEATYYDADGSGACSFEASPGDLMVAAINGTDYDGSAACGGCALVDGPDGSVMVRIVDSCPGCDPGDLDLSREAFERIAPLKAGRVPITWRYVACAVDGPVRYRFKEGSNPFWTALQVRNHRFAILSLEVRPAGGAWKAVNRAAYNYFVDEAGVGDGAFDVRVTDVHGHVVEDTGLTVGDGTEVAGAAQLATCQ